MRSSSCCNRSATVSLLPENSISFKAPLASDSQARPVVTVLRCVMLHRASSGRSAFSGSKSASVSVPGVTTRITLRSTGPLLVAGSPICSQIATDSPSFTSLAR